jgi:hypothetical protein
MQEILREVSEWFKEVAWKVAIPQKGIGGSNPFLSANRIKAEKKEYFQNSFSFSFS